MRCREANRSGLSKLGDLLVARGNLKQEALHFGVPKPAGNCARLLGAL
jgi:hypothetical protein